MKLGQQELMNAVCLHMAERKQVKPEQVEVELLWDEDTGYSAEVWVDGRSQYLIEANLYEAVLHYCWSEHGVRAFRDSVKLDIDEEANEMVAWVE